MLSQKVFAVYCDHFVRDAVEKNEQLSADNDKMEAARHMLVHMNIYNGYSGPAELAEIDLRNPTIFTIDQQDENVSWRVFDLANAGIDFPFEQIPGLRIKLCGTSLADRAGHRFGGGCGYSSKYPPQLSLLDQETLKLEFYISHEVKITGTLTHFTGELHEVKRTVENLPYFNCQFMFLGAVNPGTGQPHQLLQNNRPLAGAIFCIKKVQVIEQALPSTAMSDYVNEEENEDDEVQVLAKANKKHMGLFNAALNCKKLKARNVVLNKSRELLQTITAHYPGGCNTIQFRLDGGSIGRHMLTSDQHPAWAIEPMNKEESTIPISAISKLEFQLAGIRWNRPPHGIMNPNRPGLVTTIADRAARAANRQRRMDAQDSYIIMQYSHCFEATFTFDDESMAEVDLDRVHGGIFGYLNMAFHGRLEEEQVTPIRLVSLHISMEEIKPRLDVLGIEANDIVDDE